MQHEHSITEPPTEQPVDLEEQAHSGASLGLPASLEATNFGDGSPRKRRWPKILLVLLVVAAIVVILRLTILAPRPVVVNVAKAVTGVVEQTITNTRAGTVEARIRARLSPETSGRVIALPHRENALVQRGELLLRLDDSLQSARLEVAIEDVRVAEARAEEACLAADLAVKELGRFTRLSDAGVASEQILDSAVSDRDRSQATCRAATAALGQAKAQQKFARAQLELTVLRAPFAGVVADLRTEIGEWLTPSPPGLSLPPVIELLDPNSLYIAAPIDEMDAARVQTGQQVRITVDSHRGQSFEGRLIRVAPYVLDVVEQNRTVEVEAEFATEELPSRLLPGTSADLEIITEARTNVLRIPTTAISEGGRVLCLVNGVLERRTLETGLSNWQFTEVVAGLSEGDLVVTSLDSTATVAGANAKVGEEQ